MASATPPQPCGGMHLSGEKHAERAAVEFHELEHRLVVIRISRRVEIKICHRSRVSCGGGAKAVALSGHLSRLPVMSLMN